MACRSRVRISLPRRSPLVRLFFDLALEIRALSRQLVVLRLHQEGVEPAAVIDRLQRIGRDAQAGTERSSASEISVTLQQVGQEPPLGLAVRVAHLVAGLAPPCRSARTAATWQILSVAGAREDGHAVGINPWGGLRHV